MHIHKTSKISFSKMIFFRKLSMVICHHRYYTKVSFESNNSLLHIICKLQTTQKLNCFSHSFERRWIVCNIEVSYKTSSWLLFMNHACSVHHALTQKEFTKVCLFSEWATIFHLLYLSKKMFYWIVSFFRIKIAMNDEYEIDFGETSENR